MSASPSLHTDGRGRWKRQRRTTESQTRKIKPYEQEEDNEDNDDELENNNHNHSEDAAAAAVAADHNNPNYSAAAATATATAMEVLIDGGVRISEFPLTIRYTVNRPHVSITRIVATERGNLAGDRVQNCTGLNLENVSYGQLQAVSALPRGELVDLESNGGGDGPCVITAPQIMEGRGVVKRYGTRVHVVPMHSDWFHPATVNRLERQVVPHFFSGKSPEYIPEKYMECRNYIVAKYMENPEKLLIVSDCQGLVDGVSTEDLNRIVRFLDHWGVINYCTAEPACETCTEGSYLWEDQNNEVHVPAEALKSIRSLISFDKPKCRLKAAEVYSSSISRGDDDSYDLDNRIREHLSENHCNYCAQPLPLVYYQSQKEVDALLCCGCFHEGRFVAGHSSIDFQKMDTSKDYADLDGESWSDQETLLLLEALEIYHENWNEIAEHVGSKSKAQCITHFLRLPIEDSLLDKVEVPSISRATNLPNGDDHGRVHSNSNGDISVSRLQEAELESRLPFANSGNPVMSLVAFLAAAVGPRVAAACAHASLAVLSQEMEGSAHGNRMNLETGRDGGFHGDSISMQQKEQNTAIIHGSEGSSISDEKVRAAAKAGLAAAATKAKLFADHEEREIQRLSANIINHQLKRLELKLKQFAEVETLLMKECEQVERTRQRFSGERARIVSSRLGPAGVAPQMNLPGATPSMVNNNFSNNRQPVMSASTSQPNASGYGNNQTSQPQMQYMQRQPMFPLGPRHHTMGPTQGSSSAQPNVMFNAPGNSQPGLSHPMLRSLSGSSSGLG
ncbi:hypothetical protein ACFE04_011500 [Oxalis oulophora]